MINFAKSSSQCSTSTCNPVNHARVWLPFFKSYSTDQKTSSILVPISLPFSKVSQQNQLIFLDGDKGPTKTCRITRITLGAHGAQGSKLKNH